MGEGRPNLKFIAVKTYYRPKELVEMLDTTEKEIVRFAYGVGALYEIEGIRLVNLPVYMESLNKYHSFKDVDEGVFMEIDDAVKKTGLSAETVTRISASAGALYQVGLIKIIDVNKLGEYIRSFPVKSDMAELEPKKLRGSTFVREICRKRQKH